MCGMIRETGNNEKKGAGKERKIKINRKNLGY